MQLMRIGELEVELNRKAIKNLHISVLPPNGKVRVAAPEHLSDTVIRTAVVQRIPWIRKQQKDFRNQPREAERQMISGETHYLWGRGYRLEVIEQQGTQKVQAAGSNKLRLYIRPDADVLKRKKLLMSWYRTELRERTEKLIPQWEKQIGVSSSFWGIKKMKTKWGSCNPASKRIWLNLELVKKPPECLEFILVHELIHLKERHHNERFVALMDKHMPQWREYRKRLNEAPLVHVNWFY
jgi:predicted metal-dependent hydrolase